VMETVGDVAHMKFVEGARNWLMRCGCAGSIGFALCAGERVDVSLGWKSVE